MHLFSYRIFIWFYLIDSPSVVKFPLNFLNIVIIILFIFLSGKSYIWVTCLFLQSGGFFTWFSIIWLYLLVCLVIFYCMLNVLYENLWNIFYQRFLSSNKLKYGWFTLFQLKLKSFLFIFILFIYVLKNGLFLMSF